MATTLYLKKTAAAAAKPSSRQWSTTPDFYIVENIGGGSDSESPPTIYPLRLSRVMGTVAEAKSLSRSFEEPGETHNTWYKAWASDSLSAQTISGTLTFNADFYEGNNALNLMPRIYAYVWKGDNSGVRGVLYEGISGTEADTSTDTMQVFFNAVSISSVDAQAGDTIVIEVTSFDNNTKTSTFVHAVKFDGEWGAMYPVGNCSYVEFSANLGFLHSVTATETLNVSETLSRRYTKALTQSLTTVATATARIVGAGGLIAKTLTDGFAVTESLSKRATLHLRDSFAASASYARNLFAKRLTQAVEFWEDAVPKYCLCMTSYFGATGEGANSWVNPENAEGLDADLSYATATPAVLSTVQGIWTYDITGATEVIKQVQILVTGLHSVKSACQAQVEVSWDGGSTWGNLFSFDGCGSTPGDHYFDVTNETEWTWAKLAQMQVRFGAYRYASPPVTAYLDRLVVVVRHGRLFRTESLTFSPVISRRWFDKRVTEPAQFTAAVSHSSSFVARLSESLSYEITSALSAHLRLVASEVLTVSDQTLRRFGKSLVEAAKFADTISQSSRFYLALTSGISYATSLSKASQSFAKLTQGFTFSDSVSRSVRWARSFSENLTFADTTSRAARFVRAFEEGLTVVDTVSASLGALRQALTENIVLAASLLSRSHFSRAFSETLTVTETLFKYSTFKRAFSEALTATESMVRRSSFVRAFTENLTLRTRPYPNGRWFFSDMETLRDSKLKNFDDETGSEDGTISGATPATGYIGGAYDFVNAADYIEMGSTGGLQFTSGWTATAWIYNRAAKDSRIITKNYRPNFIYLTSAAQIRSYHVHATQGAYAITSSVLPSNTWVWVATVFDPATGYIKVYWDAIEQSLATEWQALGAMSHNTSTIRIGQESGTGTASFDGMVDEAHLFKRPLDYDEILRLYLGKVKPTTLDQAIALTDRIAKETALRRTEQLTFTASIWKRWFEKRIDEEVEVSSELLAAAGSYLRSFVEGLSVSDATTVWSAFVRRLSSGLTFSETIPRRVFNKVLREPVAMTASVSASVPGQMPYLSEQITIVADIIATLFHVRALTESATTEGTVVIRLSHKRWISAVAGVASLASNWNDGVAPTTGDDVFFGDYGTGDCDWDVTDTVGDILIDTGYTGAFSNSAVMKCDDFTQRDGTYNQGNTTYYYGDFLLEGGTHYSLQDWSTYYYGNFTATGGTWTTYKGQIVMMSDGMTMTSSIDIKVTHLGFRGNTTVKDSNIFVGHEFYIIGVTEDKTLTIDNSRVELYDFCITNLAYYGSPVINGVNGGRLVFRIWDNRTMDSDIQYFDINCDIEFNRVSGGSADKTLTLSRDINVGTLNDIYVLCDDATYYNIVDPSASSYDFYCRNFTVGQRGYVYRRAADFHIYGNFDGGYAVQGRVSTAGTVHMYSDGTTFTSGYAYTYGRIYNLYLHITPGQTITHGLASGQATVIDGTINGDGGTFALGDSRLYLYTWYDRQNFYGTGTITSNSTPTKSTTPYGGFYFILYVLSATYYSRNLNQGNWVFDCDVFFDFERSMTGAVMQGWLTGDITTTKVLRLPNSTSAPPADGILHLEGYDLTAAAMVWNKTNSTYSHIVVDASTGSSIIRVTGSDLLCALWTSGLNAEYWGSGSSLILLEGTGDFWPQRIPAKGIDFDNVTITGTYEVEYGYGYVYGDRLGVNFTTANGGKLITVRDYEESLTISDGVEGRPRFNFNKVLAQDATFTETMSLGFFKRLEDALAVTDTVSTLASFVRSLTESFGVDASIRKDIAMRLAQSIEVSYEMFRTFYGLLRLGQGLTIGAETSMTGSATPYLSSAWLGSFSRPSTGAIVLQLTKGSGVALSNATVTATIRNPETGALYRSVTFTETATTGIYRGTFRILQRDPVGTYPVSISARYGINSSSYEGYVIVYAGAPWGIRYY